MNKKPSVYERTIRATPIDKVDWKEVSEHAWNECDISIDFIREYADYLDWHVISYQRHTIEFYREFGNYLNWWYVAQSEIGQKKINEFKYRFIDNWDWEEICKNSKLSKKFVERNTELVNWDRLFIYQYYDKNFLVKNVKRYSDDVDIDGHLRNWGIYRDEY